MSRNLLPNLETDSAASPNSYSDMFQDASSSDEDMYGYTIPHQPIKVKTGTATNLTTMIPTKRSSSTTSVYTAPFDEKSVVSSTPPFDEKQQQPVQPQQDTDDDNYDEFGEDQSVMSYAPSVAASMVYQNDDATVQSLQYYMNEDEDDNQSVEVSSQFGIHSVATMSYGGVSHHSVQSLQFHNNDDGDDTSFADESVELSFATSTATDSVRSVQNRSNNNNNNKNVIYVPSPFATSSFSNNSSAEEEEEEDVSNITPSIADQFPLQQYTYNSSSNSSTDPPSSSDDLESQKEAPFVINGREYHDASVASSSVFSKTNKNKKQQSATSTTTSQKKKTKKEKKKMSCCKKCLLISVPAFILLVVGGGIYAYLNDFWGFFGSNETTDEQQGQGGGTGNFWAPSSPIWYSSETEAPSAAPFNADDSAATTLSPTAAAVVMTPTNAFTAMDYRRTIQTHLEGKGISFDESVTNLKALNWLVVDVQAEEPEELEEENLFLTDTHRLAQRFALYALGLSLETFGSISTTTKGDLIFQRLQEDSKAPLSQFHCFWPGVSCTAGVDDESKLEITSITLHDQVMDGSIPSEIALLSSLTSLDLSKNYLHGSIPSGVFEIGSLEKVYLYQNMLSGELPSTVAQANRMTHLHLSHNKINGSLPNFNSGLRKYRFCNFVCERHRLQMQQLICLVLCTLYRVPQFIQE